MHFIFTLKYPLHHWNTLCLPAYTSCFQYLSTAHSALQYSLTALTLKQITPVSCLDSPTRHCLCCVLRRETNWCCVKCRRDSFHTNSLFDRIHVRMSRAEPGRRCRRCWQWCGWDYLSERLLLELSQGDFISILSKYRWLNRKWPPIRWVLICI